MNSPQGGEVTYRKQERRLVVINLRDNYSRYKSCSSQESTERSVLGDIKEAEHINGDWV